MVKLRSSSTITHKSLLLCFHYRDLLLTNLRSPYLPIQCGKSVASAPTLPGMIGDDSGDSISSRNSLWSEITGLYWVWKNIDLNAFDAIGTCSYRRFFDFSCRVPMTRLRLIKPEDCEPALSRIYPCKNLDLLYGCDVAVPIPYIYPYPLWVALARNYRLDDFDILASIISSAYPDDAQKIKKVLNSSILYGHNMFVMRPTDLSSFCSWAFPILFAVEKSISVQGYNSKASRVLGYMFEILLTTYVRYNFNSVRHLPLVVISSNSNFARHNSFLRDIAARLISAPLGFLLSRTPNPHLLGVD